ncbi:hypothetical protein GALMADRAFT_146260 [Galerina marginata CBS 339.88]|uniref:Uncharacterized protein n=1 Tax=Galerina marginata (strain CBS 339.88) TaxID=685588 RepID=A0A067SPB0_GALM3|nr:hypothetical protein GALMADRAFT_146260 [Galerina marginata CBS 339.88]
MISPNSALAAKFNKLIPVQYVNERTSLSKSCTGTHHLWESDSLGLCIWSDQGATGQIRCEGTGDCCSPPSLLSKMQKHIQHAIDGVDHHRAAERHMGRQRLAVAQSQHMVSIAQQCASVRQDQETDLLLDLRDCGGEHTPQNAFKIARAARNTLVAEADLAMTKLKECQHTLILREAEVEEALTYVADGEHQIGNLLDVFDHSELPFITTQYCPVPASVFSSHQSQLDTYLPIDRFARRSDLPTPGTSSSGVISPPDLGNQAEVTPTQEEDQPDISDEDDEVTKGLLVYNPPSRLRSKEEETSNAERGKPLAPKAEVLAFFKPGEVPEVIDLI